jgi:hypothetical protein
MISLFGPTLLERSMVLAPIMATNSFRARRHLRRFR